MAEKVGLLLVNLGSPSEPSAQAVRTYLAEFLHDPRVIDTSRWIWCPILHGVILRIRPARSAKAYGKIWGAEGSEAPLIQITRKQAEAVQALMPHDVIVDIAMRYGQPSIELALDRLMAKGCHKIAVLPLYPQFAGATTASVNDAVGKALKKRTDIPEIRFLRDYHDDKDYIEALALSLEDALLRAGSKPDVIMCSYHGLPQSYVDKGDPYQEECRRTTDLLRERMGMSNEKLIMTFQSRFGPKQWLQPYTDKTLERLAGEGKKHVMIITPGFAADCLETLEEIAMEAKETFADAGGETLTVVPCLNTRQDHIEMLAKLARQRLLAGWVSETA